MLNGIIFFWYFMKKFLCFWNFISSIPRTDNNEIYTPCSLSVSSSVLYTLYKLSVRTSLRRSSFKLKEISWIPTESDHRKTKAHKARSNSFHYIKWIILLKTKTKNNKQCIYLYNVMLEYLAETIYMHTSIFNK